MPRSIRCLAKLIDLFLTGTAGSYLFFSLPFGMTVVVGATGRVDEPDTSLGGLVSFFGFFTILLLRCSPLGMSSSWW
jgi:hypothetical protein